MTSGDFLGQLRARAQARPRTLVYPEGDEARVLDAAVEIVGKGLARVVLIGAETTVVEGLRGRGADPADFEVLDPSSEETIQRTRTHVAHRRAGKPDTDARLDAMARDPLMQGATMVALGAVDGAVAGCVRTTADVVRSALLCVGLAEGLATLSSAFYMVFDPAHPVGPRVLTFTDAGVVPAPTSDQLTDIAVSAAAARASVVGDEPRVAFLSYSTRGSARGSAVQRMRDAFQGFRERRPDIPADGEIQGDAALSEAVASRKAPGSPIAGNANVLVFPDLGAANIAYKLVQYLGGAVALGPVLQGLARPCNDLSRGAVASDIVAVSCITALSAR